MRLIRKARLECERSKSRMRLVPLRAAPTMKPRNRVLTLLPSLGMGTASTITTGASAVAAPLCFDVHGLRTSAGGRRERLEAVGVGSPPSELPR